MILEACQSTFLYIHDGIGSSRYVSLFLMIFWYTFGLTSIRSAVENGMYHVVSIQLTLIVFDLFGISPVGRSSLYDLMIAVGLVVYMEFIFLNRKKYNRPVYLAYSRKTVLSRLPEYKLWFFQYLPMSKHWCVVVPSSLEKRNQFLIFESKGVVFSQMSPQVSLIDKRELVKKYLGFHRLGLTSSGNIRKLRRLNFIFQHKMMNCQMYSHFVQTSLVWPHLTVDYFYGRISYYIMMSCIALFAFCNYFVLRPLVANEAYMQSLDFVFDLNLLYISFMFYDFFTENKILKEASVRYTRSTTEALYYYKEGGNSRSNGLKKKNQCSIYGVCLGPVFFTIVRLLIPSWMKINGYLPLFVVFGDFICAFIILPLTVESFKNFTGKEKKKRKKK